MNSNVDNDTLQCQMGEMPVKPQGIIKVTDDSANRIFLAFRSEVAELIVDSLVLEDIVASEISPDAPLFGDGLSLDSIDALEIAFAVSEKYGFKLRSDDEKNEEIFACLDSLARHIFENKAR